MLNWSERKTWDPRRSEVALFRRCIGDGSISREYNPVAVVVPRQRPADIIGRYWKAFRDAKHGKPQRLQRAEADLERALAAAAEQK